MVMYIMMLESGEERQDFQQIYQQNYRRMYHTALGILKNQTDAEDAVQQAFLSLAENFRRYRKIKGKDMASFCIVIVKHKAIDILRAKGHMSEEKLEELVLVDKAVFHQPELAYEEKEKNMQLKIILEKLPEILKEVLYLRYYYDMENRTIAKTLGISKKTVEMRLYRGKIKLRELLENEGK